MRQCCISPRWLVVFAILLLLAPAAVGQKPSHTGTGGGAPRDLQNREWALTHVSEEVNRHFKKEDRSSLLPMRDDFQQLQIVNNELMKRVFVKKNISLPQIQAALTDLRKHAMRLKAFLTAFNDDANREKKTNAAEKHDQQEMSAALLKLDSSVMSFVNNPLFQQTKVLDTKLAVQANDDLDEIIRLAASLNQLTTEKKPQ